MENCKLALKCALTANVLSDYLGENSIRRSKKDNCSR